MTLPSLPDPARGSLLGCFIADALAMPAHWYYDLEKLRADYGHISGYVAPRNPHTESLMDEAVYQAPNPRGEILHDQAKYWGKAGIHYHQFLKPGENTLTLQLARVVLNGLAEDVEYDVDLQVERYLDFMITPGRHHDTYIEVRHQHFFKLYAQGRHPLHCGREDNHIGGLTSIVPIVACYHDNPEAARAASLQHLYLTQLGEPIKQAARFMINSLLGLFAGCSLKDVLQGELDSNPLLKHPIEDWLGMPDQEIVGGQFKASGYVDHSIPCVTWLALKYGDDPEQALIANTNLGGDNCYRGAVLGAILGAAHGTKAWPERWVKGLARSPLD